MKEKIIESVAKLDVANDNHWTADGLPRLDTLRILLMTPSLSREDVESAIPNFKRGDVVAQNSAQANETPASSNPPTATEETAPASVHAQETAEELPVLNQALTETVVDLEGLQKELEDARANMEEASKVLADAQRNYIQAQNEFAYLENEVDKRIVNTEGSPIQGYLKQQNADLEDRIERQRAIAESGLTIKDIVTQGRSALDQAFMSRRNRQRGIRQ